MAGGLVGRARRGLKLPPRASACGPRRMRDRSDQRERPGITSRGAPTHAERRFYSTSGSQAPASSTTARRKNTPARAAIDEIASSGLLFLTSTV